MFHRWAALVLVLALCAMTPKNAAGQTQSTAPRGHSAGGLGNNYPNPFNPVTYIPFTVGDPGCSDVSANYVVTVRIVNVLAQHTATPILYGTSSTSTTSASGSLNGRPLTNLTFACGDYVAFWDGKVTATGKEAASSVYLVQLIVNGQLVGTKKILYAK